MSLLPLYKNSFFSDVNNDANIYPIIITIIIEILNISFCTNVSITNLNIYVINIYINGTINKKYLILKNGTILAINNRYNIALILTIINIYLLISSNSFLILSFLSFSLTLSTFLSPFSNIFLIIASVIKTIIIGIITCPNICKNISIKNFQRISYSIYII